MILTEPLKHLNDNLVFIVTLSGLIIGLFVNSDKILNYIGKRLTIRGLNRIENEDIKDDTYVGEKFNLDEKIDERLTDILEITKENRNEIEKIRMLQKRAEIIQLIHMEPNRIESIERTYDDYKALGGNSYVDDVILIWREHKAKNELKNRIKIKD